MKITILGSGTCVPSAKRSSAAILVSSGDKDILLDCGPGTLRRLAEIDADLNRISAIVVSHFHIDHIGDLVPFVFSSKYNPDHPRKNPLKIIASPGIKLLYRHLAAAYGSQVIPDKFNLEFIESRNDKIQFFPWTVVTKKVIHSENSLAIKLRDQNGRSLVYSGDTDYCAALVDLSRSCNLLVLECAFPEGHKKNGHLVPVDVGRIANACQPGKLVLTHFYPICENYDILSQVKCTYSGEICLAQDLMQLDV